MRKIDTSEINIPAGPRLGDVVLEAEDLAKGFEGRTLIHDLSMDGQDLGQPPFSLTLPTTSRAIVTGPRIGITRAADYPWRFGLAGSPFVSSRFPVADQTGR